MDEAPMLDDKELLYDWAQAGPHRFEASGPIELNDETLRDGLQSPAVSDPEVETKVRILHLMDALGIETADVGLPAAGRRQRESVERLCREIASQRLSITPNCAGRTLSNDVRPMAEVSQATGIPIEACLFTGASPIRQLVEGWSLEQILARIEESIRFAVGEGLPTMFVTEDTIRCAPDDLRQMLAVACDAGARRVCLCDTVGAGVPQGVSNLVLWVRNLLVEIGHPEVGIDWHGHRDRGFALANSMAALEAGATRIHGTALGLGERVGNTPMEQLLVNLRLVGLRSDPLDSLQEYAVTIAESFDVHIPANTPIVGRDAFRTATGVHAAAVVKALEQGSSWLANRVYAGVPACWLGREQEIEIGPMSGKANVSHYLSSRGLSVEKGVATAVLARAKTSKRLLTEKEVLAVVEELSAGQG